MFYRLAILGNRHSLGICCSLLLRLVALCVLAEQAGKPTANSTLTTNSNYTGTTTTTTTATATTTKATTTTTTTTITTTTSSSKTTNATRPETTLSSKANSDGTAMFTRRSSSTPANETTTNSTKLTGPETRTAATDGGGIHDAGVKGRVVRVNVIYIIVGVVASIFVKGCVIVYLCRKRLKSKRYHDQGRLSVAYSTPDDIVTLKIERNSVPNNNVIYSEVSKVGKSDLSFKTSENGRVQSLNTYDEIKDRKNPLYSSSDNPNIYEELKESKNPLYSGSADAEKGRKRNNPIYERNDIGNGRKRNNPVYERI